MKQLTWPLKFWATLTITILITACLAWFANILLGLLATSPLPSVDDFGMALTPPFSLSLMGALAIMSIIYKIKQ